MSNCQKLSPLFFPCRWFLVVCVVGADGRAQKKRQGRKAPAKQATSPAGTNAKQARTQGGAGRTNRNGERAGTTGRTRKNAAGEKGARPKRTNRNTATPSGEGTQGEGQEGNRRGSRKKGGNPTAGGTETPKETGGGRTGTARHPKSTPRKEGTEPNKPPNGRRRGRRPGRQGHQQRQASPGDEKRTPKKRNNGTNAGSEHNKHPQKAENKHGKPNASKPAHGTLTLRTRRQARARAPRFFDFY